MQLAVRGASKCLFCAFRTSQWTAVAGAATGSKRFYRDRMPKSHRNTSASSSTPTRTPQMIPKSGRELRFRGSRTISGPLRASLQAAIVARLILRHWTAVRGRLSEWSKTSDELQTWGVDNRGDFRKNAADFTVELEKCCAEAVDRKATEDVSDHLWMRLRKAYTEMDVKGVVIALKYSFTSYIIDRRFTSEDVKSQGRLTDLRYPIEWYPEARAMQRKIHLHVGPTNSGKTYQALRKLEAAESGIYAGPLRLLAHEVYTRLNAKKKLCALITGEERRFPESGEALLSSCTVEMVPLNTEVDVAVIDEIQMMGDVERGWAWTQAFLGVKAKEVHLCGELRTIPLIQQLCASMGDSLQIHKYERLSPLKAMDSSLKGNLKKLEKGDAIILFSRLAIHAMKKEIEQTTGRRCAVVYGSLPPETRAQQANLFNEPDNDYDFLVASDAVGMGLNLSIKRIIFEATSKHDGTAYNTINISEIKQIAGRAGRYRTAAQAVQNSLALQPGEVPKDGHFQTDRTPKKNPKTIGLVTTLEDFDMPILHRAMSSVAPPLATAGITAPPNIVSRFAAYFPENTPFSYILLRLHDICTINPLFHLCRFKDQIAIADAIQSSNLTINDRITFIAAPANLRDEGMLAVLKAFAKCVADQTGGDLLDIKQLNLEFLDEAVDVEGKEYLRKLEALHKAITLYLWLSYRFAGIFRSQALAFYVKGLVGERIGACLARVQLDSEKRKRLQTIRRQTALSEMSKNQFPGVGDGQAQRGEVRIALPSSWKPEFPADIMGDAIAEKKAQRLPVHR